MREILCRAYYRQYQLGGGIKVCCARERGGRRRFGTSKYAAEHRSVLAEPGADLGMFGLTGALKNWGLTSQIVYRARQKNNPSIHPSIFICSKFSSNTQQS